MCKKIDNKRQKLKGEKSFSEQKFTGLWYFHLCIDSKCIILLDTFHRTPKVINLSWWKIKINVPRDTSVRTQLVCVFWRPSSHKFLLLRAIMLLEHCAWVAFLSQGCRCGSVKDLDWWKMILGSRDWTRMRLSSEEIAASIEKRWRWIK